MQFSDAGSSVLVLAKDTLHTPLSTLDPALSNLTEGVLESFAEVQHERARALKHMALRARSQQIHTGRMRKGRRSYTHWDAYIQTRADTHTRPPGLYAA